MIMFSIGSNEDGLALLTLLSCWFGYTCYAGHRIKKSRCLTRVLAHYREHWMLRLLERDNRIADASLMNSLRASVSFFASTSILVVAGLITGIASSEQAIDVLATLPFMCAPTQELWEFKMLMMVLIFIYAFFEFTWSLRLYNFACVMLGSAPLVEEVKDDPHQKKRFATASGFILTLAARHFNFGLRAYYFALAMLSWFIGPLWLMAASVLVVLILYSREFHSRVLQVLIREAD